MSAQTQTQTVVTEREPELSPKAKRLENYLHSEVQENNGEVYMKGKFISDDVNLSAKEIGALILQLQEKSRKLAVEQWSYTSATTWRITPAQ